MSDLKYGRLFTERDVQYIVNMMRLEGAPDHACDALKDMEATGKVHFTFPSDEPLFLLRGQDTAAPAAIMAYAGWARSIGAADGHLQAARRACNAMERWQHANPERVKVPDR